MTPELSRLAGKFAQTLDHITRRRFVADLERVDTLDQVPDDWRDQLDVFFTTLPDDLRRLISSTTVAAADDSAHTGAMVALVPSPDDLDRLAVDGMEPRDELHLTLFYLGDAADITPADRDELRAVAEMTATEAAPVEAMAFGVGLWNWIGEEPAVVLNVGDPDKKLIDVRAVFAARVAEVLLDRWSTIVDMQHSPWVPHVCLAYSTESSAIDGALERTGPIMFDTLRVAYGGEVEDFPLGG